MFKKLLQLKTFLVALLVMTGAGNVWGTDIVVTLDNIGSSIGSTANTKAATTNITAEGTTDSYTLNYYQCKQQGSAMLMTKNVSPYISNKTAMPGNIKSVEVFINSGAAGKTTYDCAFSETECTTATAGVGAVNITGGNSHTYSNLKNGSINVEGKFFCITLGNSNNGQVLKLVITCESESSATEVATTTTIDATGIENTDVYTSTAAGSLSASVTSGESAVTGATVTWSGNNDNVAKIDASTGAVTLVGAGTVTFTASYAGETGVYQASSATYKMTVTSSAPYVQPTEFDIALNNTLFGTGYDGVASGITDEEPVVGTQDNVTVTYAGSGNHYVNNSQIRFYPNNKLTIDAPDGYVIKKIVFTSAGTWTATIGATLGDYTSNTKTWEGEATSVVFSGSGSGRCEMSNAAITLGVPSNDPSISAEDVNIAYDATNGSIAYTLTNEVTGGVLTATTSPESWLTPGTVTAKEVSFTCTANEANTERTATVTLTYSYDTDKSITKTVTVTQEGYVPDYATLPFVWEGGASSVLTDLNGVTAYDLGNDYAGSNAPYNVKLDDTGDYIQVKTDSQPGKVTICVKMLGGGNSSTIKVQESANGETFSNVESLSISGNQNDVLILETTKGFASPSRYVRLLFTKGSNVGVGAITIVGCSPLTISLNAACNDGGMVYGTYSSSHPFVVSDDIVVSEISIVNDAFHVEEYKTGDVVPANTGVMVSALEGGDYTVNVAATAGTSVLGPDNCLRPTGDDGITAEAMGADDAGCLFYRLTMHNGTKIGYWWGAENGAAFAVAANKAYMAIPKDKVARMMGNGFSEIFTGIVSTEQQRESVATYNLLGQRVSPDTKGVLIRNGKKLINK